MAANLNLIYNEAKQSYYGKFRNLIIWINNNGIYSIKGSIWNFYHGKNDWIFTRTEFAEAVNEINSLTFGTFSCSKVVALEFGINITTIHEPDFYLTHLQALHWNNRFLPLFPKYKLEKIWKIETLKRYLNIKIYVKDSIKKILRIEVVFNNIKCATKANQPTIHELCQAEVQEKFADDFLKKVGSLICKPILPENRQDIGMKEVYKRNLITQIPFFEIVKIIKNQTKSKSAYHKEVTECKKLYNSLNNTTTINELVCKSILALKKSTLNDTNGA